MEREQVLAVIVKHLRDNVSEVTDETIDPARSMIDYGASSLDIVEIVSASMRELKVRVPRTDLADLSTIDELVDKLTEAMNNAGSA